MFILAASAGPSTVWPFLVAIAFGVLLATAGHIVRSRTMVLTGIVIFCGVSLAFVVWGWVGTTASG